MTSQAQVPGIVLLVASISAAAAASCAGEKSQPAPPPSIARVDLATVVEEEPLRRENEDCARCHAEIAREWSASLHKSSFDDPLFLAAYAIEPLAFCRGCHAPEADAAREPSADARSVGVACTTCHEQGGHIVGGTARDADARGHAVVADARMSTTGACASCHEFDFPEVPGAPMQSTVSEHASSTYASTSCQECHMPVRRDAAGRDYRAHDFRVLGNDELLSSAVVGTAKRSGLATVDVALTAGKVGHAFPTGDMFRNLEVRAVARPLANTQARAFAATPVFLGRTFATSPREGGGVHRLPLEDLRVPPPGKGDRVATLRFGAALEDVEVAWSVVYRRVDVALGWALGVDVTEEEIEVASGTLRIPGCGEVCP